jgi:hypothetical protein
MKQSSTLENDLAMIINLLAEMVECNYISQKKMEQIMDNLFNHSKNETPMNLPGENVVKSIMNYSKACHVLKTNDKKTYTLIVN